MQFFHCSCLYSPVELSGAGGGGRDASPGVSTGASASSPLEFQYCSDPGRCDAAPLARWRRYFSVISPYSP